jgi:hypothetical protein
VHLSSCQIIREANPHIPADKRRRATLRGNRRCRAKRRADDERRLWLCLVGGLSLGVFSHDAVHAHDHEHPELNKWFESLKSGKGLCCNGRDAVHVADPDWQTNNGHYRVRIDVSSEMGKVDMEWIDVPDEAVITDPNLSGHTLLWPVRGYLGVTIRCFMPGTMT